MRREHERMLLRARLERLTALARHLGPADAALVRCHLERGVTLRDLARVSGGSAHHLRRRLRRILRRLESPEFAFTVLCGGDMPPRQRRIAGMVFVQGLGLRAAAARASCTLHCVRREIRAVRTRLREMRAEGRVSAIPESKGDKA